MLNSTFKTKSVSDKKDKFNNLIESNLDLQDDPVLMAITVDYFSSLKNNPRKFEIENHFDFNGFIDELLAISPLQKKEENSNKLLTKFIVNSINEIANFQDKFEHDETCSDILNAITLAIRYFIKCNNQSGDLLLPPQGKMIDSTHELIIGIKSENLMITADHYYDPTISANCAMIRDLDLNCF